MVFGLGTRLCVADALEWCLRQSGVTELDHYLDDYINLGRPDTDQCRCNLSRILQHCAILGVPIAAEKIAGPSPCLTYLGIEIDTMAGELHLPAEKLARIQDELARWSQCHCCRRQQLESLVGLLHHTSCMVRPGRSFLRQMIALLGHSFHPYHHIHLTKQFQADLLLWHTSAEMGCMFCHHC